MVARSVIQSTRRWARRAASDRVCVYRKGHGIAWCVAAVGVGVVVVWGCWGCDARHAARDTQRVVMAGKAYALEVALDPQSRYQGLSDRDAIPDHGGMLFVFPQPRRLDFVMRRCLVPIDLIYLGPGGRIVKTHEMQVQPYQTPEGNLKRYPSVWPAQFAIELKSRTVRSLGLNPGMKINLPLDALKQQAR